MVTKRRCGRVCSSTESLCSAVLMPDLIRAPSDRLSCSPSFAQSQPLHINDVVAFPSQPPRLCYVQAPGSTVIQPQHEAKPGLCCTPYHSHRGTKPQQNTSQERESLSPSRSVVTPTAPVVLVCFTRPRMTNYRNYGKVAKTPRRPYEKERLDRELKLVGEYGQSTNTSIHAAK